MFFYGFAKLDGVFVHYVKLIVVNEKGVLQRLTHDTVKDHNNGKLNKEGKTAAKHIVAVLLIHFLYLHIHLLLGFSVRSVFVLTLDSYFLGTESRLLYGRFLLLYGKRQKHKFHNERKKDYGYPVIILANPQAAFHYIPERYVKNVHNVQFDFLFSFLFCFAGSKSYGGGKPPALRLSNRHKFYTLFILFFLSLWDRIVPAFAKRLAAQKTPQTQKKADNNAPFLYCLYGILGAGGIKTAIGAQTG